MMQTSAHGLTKPPLRRTAAGFTLLELLVVLVIAGIMLGAIALNAVPGDRQVVQSEAQRVALLLQLARDEAIVRNRPIAFEADQDRYRFLIRQNDNWEMLAQDAVLREREFKRRPLQLSIAPTVGDSLPGITLALGSQSALIRADGIGHFQVE